MIIVPEKEALIRKFAGRKIRFYRKKGKDHVFKKISRIGYGCFWICSKSCNSLCRGR